MNQDRLNHFREALLKQRPQLRREIEQRISVIPEDVIPPGDDWREPASESLDNELAVEDVQEQLYEKISNALFRIDEETYGLCLSCGRDIEEDRLEAVPYAEYCVACERRHELQEQA